MYELIQHLVLFAFCSIYSRYNNVIDSVAISPIGIMKSVKDRFFKRNQFTYTIHAHAHTEIHTFGSDGVGLVTIDKRLIKIDMPIIHLGGTTE